MNISNPSGRSKDAKKQGASLHGVCCAKLFFVYRNLGVQTGVSALAATLKAQSAPEGSSSCTSCTVGGAPAATQDSSASVLAVISFNLDAPL